MGKHQLTRCEAEVMDVVWARQAVTVQDVVDSIKRSLAYTTVMTTFKILEDKGFIERGEKRSRAIVYRPIVSRDAVRRTMARDLTERLFGGSVKSLVLSLVATEEIDAEAIAELRSAIDSLEESA